MTNKLLILTLGFLLSCGAAELPTWYSTHGIPEYDSDRYVIGKASGPYFKGKGVKFVEKDAKADISRQIQSHIKSRLDFRQYSSTHNGKEKFGSSIFDLIREETNLVISNIKRLKEHVDEDKKIYYTAIAIDRKELALNYRNDIIDYVNKMKEYSNPSSINETFLYYRVKEKLKQKIELAKIKGKLYGNTYYSPFMTPIPPNALTEYKLRFTSTTPTEHHEIIAAMLVRTLGEFGIAFNESSPHELLCDLKLTKIDGRSKPTIAANFTLYEVKKGQHNIALREHFPETHPTSYEELEGLIIRTWLAVRLKAKLALDLDPKIDKMLK